MKKATALLVLGSLIASSASATPIQWSAASGGNDHWYEFFATNVKWDAARAAAAASTYQGQQGYLVTSTSAAENDFIYNSVTRGVLSWLGASDAGVEGTWVWADGPEAGQTLSWTNWFPGEPNNCCGGEDYLQISWASNDDKWNDHGGPGTGAAQANGYVVEYSSATQVPEPASLGLTLAALLAAGVSVRRRRG